MNNENMAAKMSEAQIPGSSIQESAFNLINQINLDITNEISGRLDTIFERIAPALRPSPPEPEEPESDPIEARSDIINSLQGTKRKADAVIKVLDHLIERIDI